MIRQHHSPTRQRGSDVNPSLARRAKVARAPDRRGEATVSDRVPLEGHRGFTWFKPQKQRPTEYESYTVGLQSSPKQWLHVGWPCRFEDGREPFSEASTALRLVTPR